MFGTHDLLLFIAAGLLLNVTPGPDTLYIVGRSTALGWRAGAVAALGIGAGCFVHIAAAAIGLSALITASAQAFLVVKWIGAAYLCYVGFGLLRTRATPVTSANPPAASSQTLRGIFLQGCLTNALNPKVALFFLAFLPQFVTTGAPHQALAFVFLGVLFTFNGTLWNLFVAWSSDRLAGGLLRGGRLAMWFNRFVGGVFVFVGLRLALTSRN
jgi:threonine/homoserine/homoserine lactone efflux protein